MKLVMCQNPRCRVQLLVSNERAPACGKCGTAILLDQYVSSKPSLGFISHFKSRLFGLFGRNRTPGSFNVEGYEDARAKADFLAKKGWGARSDIQRIHLVLQPSAIKSRTSHTDVVSLLLTHVRRVLPNLAVPMMIPRVVVETTTLAAGQFLEQDGWIKISVSTNFFRDERAARAILCHELCHYVLLANGIRQAPTLQNERLTDVAMFAFGLGEIFLDGYRASATEYRPGHRLGYLSDSEYQFLRGYVLHLRSSEDFLRAAKLDDDGWRWDRSLR